MPLTRVFFTTDLHGSHKCFLKFLNATKVYNASVLIVGGDVTGKIIVPIVERPHGFVATYQGVERHMKSEKEVVEFERMIMDAGGYPYRTTPEELEKLAKDNNLLDELFKKLMLERFVEWIRIAEEKLKNMNVQCFITPGNDDDLYIDEAFNNSEIVVNPEGKVIDIRGGYQMISSGYASKTPWNCPRDVEDEELAKIIDRMTSQVSDFSRCLFNLHCPPYGTPLDEAPKLDENLKPVLGLGGTPVLEHVGSMAVRNAIEKHQPLLSLHGHIHEARAVIKLGRTLCINPGSEYSEGILKGVIVNLEGDRIKGYLLTSG